MKVLIVWKICSNVPNELIGRLQELFLKYSFFEFDDKLYQQCVGTSMGSKPAPACGNIFMLIYNFFCKKHADLGPKNSQCCYINDQGQSLSQFKKIYVFIGQFLQKNAELGPKTS